jgi:hypothetical protein
VSPARAALAALVVALAGCAAPTPAAKPREGGAPHAVALRNPGFENAPRVAERCAEHWSCTMHADPEAFRFTLDGRAPAAGQRSLCIERLTHEPWALATQAIDDPGLRGRRLRFSLALRAETRDGRGAGPWVLVQGAPEGERHFESLVARTDGWQRMAVEFTVAPGATLLEVGAVLEAGGRACIDEARLEILGPR